MFSSQPIKINVVTAQEIKSLILYVQALQDSPNLTERLLAVYLGKKSRKING